MHYLGLDINLERLQTARKSVELLDGRATLRHALPHQVPVAHESVDVVLAIRAMQNLPDTTPLIDEAVRVLKPGGRLIAVEPDGLAETFYFNGHLTAYNLAFNHLCQQIDYMMAKRYPKTPTLGRPGLSLGPKLPARLEAAGLQVRSVQVHASANVRPVVLARLLKRLRGYPKAMSRAAGMPRKNPHLQAIKQTIQQLSHGRDLQQQGLGGNLLPLFFAIGVKT